MAATLTIGPVLERVTGNGKFRPTWKGRVAGLVLASALAGGPVLAQSQMELTEQSSQAFARADDALNKVYGRLLAKVSPAGKDALRRVQRTWITFRDGECEFETMGTVGGSAHAMVLLECKARLTEVRTKDLQAQVSCEEGNLSCGGQ